MHSLILHVRSKSHPLWQVHAQSHLTRHLKIPPPLASTCKVSSYTSYQNPTPSGKYMRSLILHVISKSRPLWQLHAQSHLVSSYTSYQNPTPSGKYMHSLILHVISKSHPLWQVHAQSHLTHHIKIPPPWQVHAQSQLPRCKIQMELETKKRRYHIYTWLNWLRCYIRIWCVSSRLRCTNPKTVFAIQTPYKRRPILR